MPPKPKQATRRRPRLLKTGQLDSSGPLSFAPTTMTRVQRGSPARMRTLPNGDCEITHREYFADVTAGTGSPSVFDNNTFSINPGQNTMFPWLSKIASNFESYRFDKLQFEYETDAPSSLGGTVVLAVDYDASDPPAVSKQQAQAYRSFVKSAPWKECTFTSITEDLRKLPSFYVRPTAGVQPVNTDIKTYDVGTLNVITQGVTSASALCGELYVQYSIRLITPVYENLSAVYGGSITGAGTLTASNPLGTAPSYTFQGASIQQSVVTFTTPGTYLISSLVEGSSITALTLTASTGGTLSTLASSNPSGYIVVIAELVTTAPNVSLTFAATASTITQSNVWVGSSPTGSL